MADYARKGAGHLAALMHSALKRGDSAALAGLHAEHARRNATEQEMCRREWVRQCKIRKRYRGWESGASQPTLSVPP